MDSCCASRQSPESSKNPSPHGRRIDWLLWISVAVIIVAVMLYLQRSLYLDLPLSGQTFVSSVHELITRMAWGIILGMLVVGLLGLVPREMITALLGKGGSFSGILRATFAGVLLDLCSHGILMVAAKLYERGASLGQVMAFLIASPWNSFSLTLILWSLVGFRWMIAILLLSLLIALISGILFDLLVRKGILPHNPHKAQEGNGSFFVQLRTALGAMHWSPGLPLRIAKESWSGSQMVLRWVFFGVILASLIRTFFDPHLFATFFGPTLLGLGLTIVAATIIEVCSEGSLPIAADLLTRAKAPGNAFAFLMTGVSTDYTEIMVLKETTKSWKISLFLPLVTVPQVLVVAWLLNGV